MIRSRIRKDLSLQWSIFATDGTTRTPYAPSADSVVMLITPYKRIKITDAQIVGNEVRWTFEGRKQQDPGIYSLELIENEGKPGMLTVDSCKAFELVAHTCEESLDSDGAIQVQTVLLESTVLISIGGGYDDTEIKKELARLGRDKADKSELKKKVSVDVVISPTNDAQVLMSAFKTYDLANKLNVPMQCLIKKERSDEDYMLATLIVEDYRSINAGYRLTFSMYGNKANAMSGGKIDEQSVYSPDAQSVDNILSYLYNEQYGYVIPLGVGNTAFPELENKVKEMLKGKVDVEKGKGLSTNDFTDELKEKVSSFKIDEGLDSRSRNPVANSVVTKAFENIEYNISKLPKAPDWLSDVGQDGYIKNRTHWWRYGRREDDSIYSPDLNPCTINGIYDVSYSSVLFENVIIDGTPKIYTSIPEGYQLVITKNSTYGIKNPSGMYVSGVASWRIKEIQQLSEIYIPNTIARKDELSEIRAELKRLDEVKAEKSELTELSEQVGILSEEIADKQDLYIAEYGVTTREQIKAAWEAKKHIVCFENNLIYNLTNYGDAADIYFANIYYDVSLLVLGVNGVWSKKSIDHERSSNKVKTINEASTDTQYPSAKAVYDFVQTTLGAIINGEY